MAIAGVVPDPPERTTGLVPSASTRARSLAEHSSTLPASFPHNMTVANTTVTVYIHRVSREDERYGIEELADLGGVSRRTVRYYIQERLLPAPLGVGRGRHYGREHLDALLEVRSLQEAGRTLNQVRRALSGKRAAATAQAAPAPMPPSVWRRLTLAPGVELHLAADVRVPSAAGLERLTEWCRVHLGRSGDDEHAEE